MKGKPVSLSREQRAAVGAAFVYKLLKMGCKILILSCGPTHVHALMAPSEENIEKQIGKAKQFASLKCPKHKGQLWGEGTDVESVETRQHARSLFGYLRDHEQKEDAWIWRFDCDPPPPKPR